MCVCGFPYFVFLPFAFYLLSFAAASFASFIFFTSYASFTGHDDQLPLCNCQRWVAEAAGLGGHATNRAEAPGGVELFKRAFGCAL